MAAPSPTLGLYGDCVASLSTALGRLESSVTTLDAGVADLPRFGRVLKTVRHYELLPQPTLAAAEASLQNEIGPAVAALLDRAAHQIARQARRIATLQARAALQAGRLEGAERSAPPKRGATTVAGAAAAISDPLRARMVRQRREQLKYSIARLEREVAQKERELRQQLRQSTAAGMAADV